MTAHTIRVAQLAGLALLVALGAAGCGRRGPLEAPGAASAPGPRAAAVAGKPRGAGTAVEGQANPPGRAQVDDSDSEQEALLASPVPTPPRGAARGRGYTVPRTPFALDPLL